MSLARQIQFTKLGCCCSIDRINDDSCQRRFFPTQVCAVTAGNCTVEYYWPKLPASMGTGDTGLNTVYMLDGLKMDAVARDVSVQANRRPFMRYSNSYQTFSFVIVAPRALILKTSLAEKLWTWVVR